MFLFAKNPAWHVLITRGFFSLRALKSSVLGSASSLYPLEKREREREKKKKKKKKKKKEKEKKHIEIVLNKLKRDPYEDADVEVDGRF